MNVEKELEEMIDKFSPLLHKTLQTQKGLLDIALTAYDPLFVKGTDGSPVYKHLNKVQLKELIKNLKEDIIPMYEVSNYEEGIIKAKSILGKLQEG
jgi:hypothetical protein|tara:strand:+ start:37 stop:324 length:288 start_codon:yes stop_codon:yes gene_type:complete